MYLSSTDPKNSKGDEAALLDEIFECVDELYPVDYSPIVPPFINIPQNYKLTVKSQRIPSTHCGMCDSLDGPQCMWVCCGFIACQKCVVWYYSMVWQSGVCVACGCPFPESWSLDDMLCEPPPDGKIPTDFKALQKSQTKSKKK
jgi:hypothetical protein